MKSGRKQKLLVVVPASLTVVSAVARAALPAFPGAQGFGASAIGGRNGDVYHVTSLADTNTAGTLRYGINNAPAAGRTIVFDIGGSIVLTSNLSVSKSKITIAGQTAPGPGITLINNTPANNPASAFYKFQVTSSSGEEPARANTATLWISSDQ